MADPVNDYQFSCERYDSKESYLFVLVCLLNWIFFSQTSNLQNGLSICTIHRRTYRMVQKDYGIRYNNR